MRIKLEILNKSDNPTPEFKSPGAAGFDIAANEEVFLAARQSTLVSTGLYVVIPKGYEGQLRLRSSMYNTNLIMPNAPGTVDSDYRGEIKIALLNTNSYCPRRVDKGERIAQMVINKIPEISIEEITEKEFNMQPNQTIRDSKGFGSTGRN